MYAGTKVNWHEVLMADSTVAANNDSLPLFLCAFSSDKGTEKITDLVYSDFVKMYGSTPSFYQYGQPLLQAHKILSAGGRVLGKRIVAEDSLLGNIIIAAEQTVVTENKKNANGQQLYIDAAGNETTEVTDTVANTSYTKIKYSKLTCTTAKTLSDVEAYAAGLISTTTYPLFIICDNGRGVSVKSARITPDYDNSKRLSYMLYKLANLEDANVTETIRFSVYPDAINTSGGVTKNMALTSGGMVQLDAETYIDGWNAFIAKLAENTGYTVAELYTLDILFGCTVKGKALEKIKVDDTGLDIKTEYGIELESGSNGTFGDRPFVKGEASTAWAAQAVKFFDGSYSDEIFDLDQHKIDFCVDANYPDTVKAAIVTLANWREDFFYFRDLGLNINSVTEVETKVTASSWSQSPYVGDYMSTYEILDSYSHKQIKVTMCHGLAPLLVNHYMNNAAAPIAGEFNNFTITEAVAGTINVIPRVTPSVDQKELMDDLKVNYLNYGTDNALSIQSTYTTQDHDGPLSYSSNVIITQLVIKAIRRYCPKIRFMLMDTGATDFSTYKGLIEDNVISRYKGYFKSISLVYERDDDYINSKIFNANLYCYYRDFPQGEIFDVFAIEGSPDSNPVA